jgi:type IV secretory pathway TraG/TraD family ATPase VirD4
LAQNHLSQTILGATMPTIKQRIVLGLISSAMIGAAIAVPTVSAYKLGHEFQRLNWGRALEYEATHGSPLDRLLLTRLRPYNQPWRVIAGLALSSKFSKTLYSNFSLREPAPRPTIYMVIGLLGFAGLMIAGKAKTTKFSVHYEARWSTQSELRNFLRPLQHKDFDQGLLLAGWPNSRLFFGTFPGQLQRLETMHTAIVAATRSGKTLMVVTNLVRWQGSAVIVDPKSELRGLTARVRKNAGQRIITLDPRGNGDTMDLFASIGANEDDLAGLAKLLLGVKEQSNPAFALRAVPGVVAAIQAAVATNVSPLRFIRNHIRDPLVFAQAIFDSDDAQALFNLSLFLAGDWAVKANHERLLSDRFFTSSWGTFSSELREVLTDGVCAMFGGSDFKPEDLLTERVTTYLMFDDRAGSSKALSMILYAITARIKTLVDANPRIRKHRVLYVLEELGSVPMPNLSKEITTAAGRGLTFLFVIQDIPQLEGLYGPHGASTILNNSGAKVFYGTSDQTTAQYVESVLGYVSVPDVRVSDRVQSGKGSESTGQYKRELLSASEMFVLKPDEVIIEYRPHKIRANRVNWREIPELRNLDKIPPLEPAAPIRKSHPQPDLDSSVNAGAPQEDVATDDYIDLDD